MDLYIYIYIYIYIHLDLTNHNFITLEMGAKKFTENNDDIAFCYADVNCRSKLGFKDELFFGK